MDITAMTLKERAKAIAEKANECCYRSDGYEKRIENLAYRHLAQAVLEARERDRATDAAA